jgi:hypothetical protein
LRISLLGVDEMGKLDGIPEEEDGGIIENLNKITHSDKFQFIHRGETKFKKKVILTQSQIPSSVLILTEKPRGSLAVSGEPLSPPTVENLATTGALLPTLLNSLAQQISEIS